MKPIIKKRITSTVLILIGLSNFTYAESAPNLPQSSQLTQESNGSLEVELIEEIVIKTGDNSQNKNPNLKEGEACDDENLEPAELTPDEYQVIPMAETIPCDKVNCDNLQAAKLMKDTFKKIPMAKTTKLKPCDKKK